MTSLLIHDLPLAAELDSRAMAAVQGGKGFPSHYWSPSVKVSANDLQFDAAQMLVQSQNTQVDNGNNVAFASGISSHVTPTQNGINSINFS